jgi:hypothetical protein
MTTQESTPTYARDIQPLFRARDRASMGTPMGYGG